MKTEKYTQEQVMTALQRSKGFVSAAARSLGCTPQTVRNYCERYAEVKEVLEDERDAMVDLAELSLYKAIQDGHPWAIRLFLLTQGKSRGYIMREEITGKDGKTLAAPIVYIPREDDADDYDTTEAPLE